MSKIITNIKMNANWKSISKYSVLNWFKDIVSDQVNRFGQMVIFNTLKSNRLCSFLGGKDPPGSLSTGYPSTEAVQVWHIKELETCFRRSFLSQPLDSWFFVHNFLFFRWRSHVRPASGCSTTSTTGMDGRYWMRLAHRDKELHCYT